MSKLKTSKKDQVIITIIDWVKECQKYPSSNHTLLRLTTHYGVDDLRATLDTMTYAQLSTVLCLAVACSTKAHEDQRKWRRSSMTCHQDLSEPKAVQS